MWIFLSNAFLSIVDKGDPSGATLLVRARRRGDIEAVFPEAEVIEGTGTDYRYRARIQRRRVAEAIAQQIENIRYGNFKSTVHDHDRHDAYMDTWQAMMRFQRTEPRR